MSLPRFSPPLRALMLSCVILGLCSLAALPAFEALTAEAVAPPPEPAIPSPLPPGDPAGVLAAAINTRGPSNAATPTATAALPPPTDPFEKCLADLNEEDSTVRRQAAKNLRDGALLWQSRLEEALSRPELDPESRLVVRSIRNAIPRQRALQQLQQGTKIDLDLPPVTLRQALQALQSQAGVQFVTLDLELLESPICRSVQFRGSYWETLQYLSNRFVPAIAEAEPLPQNRPRSTPEEQQQMALRYRRQEQGLVPITPQTEEEESRDWRPTADLSMLHKLWRQPTRTLGPLCLQVDWIGWRMNLATGVETLGGKIVTTVEPGIDANKVDIDFARIDRASKPQPMVLSEDDLNGYALANHAWTFDEDLPPGEGGALVLRGNLSASVSDRGGELTVATDCHEPSGCSSSAVNCIVVPGSRMTDCNNPFSTLLPAKPDTANESAMLFCLAGNPDLAATLQQLISTQMRFEERSGKEIANPGYSVRQFSFGRQAWDASFATAYGTVPKDCTRIRLRYPLAAIQQTSPLITLDLSNTPVIADCQGDGTAADGGEYVICYNGWRRGRARVRRGGGSRSSFPSTTLGPIPTPLPPPPVPTAIDLAPWQAAAAYAHRVLTEGTPVALNLKDATFAEALLAIQGQSGGDLSEYLVLHSHLLTRRNLQFRGTYWEALHQAVELYLGRSPAAEDSDAEIDPCAAQMLREQPVNPNGLPFNGQNCEPPIGDELRHEPTLLQGPLSLRLRNISRNRSFAMGFEQFSIEVQYELDPQASCGTVQLDASLCTADGRVFPMAGLLPTGPHAAVLQFVCPPARPGQAAAPITGLRLTGTARLRLIGTATVQLALADQLARSVVTPFGTVHVSKHPGLVAACRRQTRFDFRTPAILHTKSLLISGEAETEQNGLLLDTVMNDIQFWHEGETYDSTRDNRNDGIGFSYPAECDQVSFRVPLEVLDREVLFEFKDLPVPGIAGTLAPAGADNTTIPPAPQPEFREVRPIGGAH